MIVHNATILFRSRFKGFSKIKKKLLKFNKFQGLF